jgi:hypothetical protein
MQTQSKPSRPIVFSGDIAALAHTLNMRTDEVRVAIGALIDRGHLVPIRATRLSRLVDPTNWQRTNYAL